MPKEIKKLLNERGKTYGDYPAACEFRQVVLEKMNELHINKHGKDIPSVTKIMLEDIIHKLARVAVTPGHIDRLGMIVRLPLPLSNRKEVHIRPGLSQERIQRGKIHGHEQF